MKNNTGTIEERTWREFKCYGDACNSILPENTKVRYALNYPITKKRIQNFARQIRIKIFTRSTHYYESSIEAKSTAYVYYWWSRTNCCLHYQEAVKKFVVEKILKRKTVKGKKFNLIKWKDYPDSENTFEPESNIPPKMIEAFEKS